MGHTRVEEREVGQAWPRAEDELSLAEMGVEQVELRPQLLALRGCVAKDPLEREAALDHGRTIFDESGGGTPARSSRPCGRRARRAPLATHRACRKAPRCRREEGRLGLEALDRAGDQVGVAVDVGPELEDRRLPVAARERHQVRLRHDHRKDDRAPRETLEAEDAPDLLGVGGLPVMVEDDVVNGAPLPSTPGGLCLSQACQLRFAVVSNIG
jgi:hypothetical protein